MNDITVKEMAKFCLSQKDYTPGSCFETICNGAIESEEKLEFAIKVFIRILDIAYQEEVKCSPEMRNAWMSNEAELCLATINHLEPGGSEKYE